MRPFYRKDLFRDEIIKIMPKELIVKLEQDDKKLGVLRMEKGQSYTLNSEDYEVGMVFLSGMATITAGDFKAVDKGRRKDAFSGAPTMIYIPRKTEYTITATGYGLLEIALCMVKTDKTSEPFIIEAESIKSQSKGVFNWQRQINEILTPESAPRPCRLAIGEVYGCPGPWATYPYKEDEKETIFFFKMSPNPGRRIQVIGSEEDANKYRVGSDTAVLVSKSYLPVAKIEDCQVYTLWFKAID